MTSVLSTVAIKNTIYRDIAHKPPASISTSLKQTAVIWMIGHIWAIRAIILTDLYLVETSDAYVWKCICNPENRLMNTLFVAIDFVLFMILPSLAVLHTYIRLRRFIRASKLISALHDLNQYLKNERNVLMIVVILALFWVCHIMPVGFRLYTYFADLKDFKGDITEVERWIYWASFSNPWLNIFVYVYFRDDIKTGLRRMFGCPRRRSSIAKDIYHMNVVTVSKTRLMTISNHS